MKPVVTAEEMRALDRATIDDVGIPGLTLMEVAGRAVAKVAIDMLGDARGHVAVVCGPGNNGGDGFVAARVLRDHAIDAVCYLAVPRARVGGDARAHLEILERAGGVVRAIELPVQLAELAEFIRGADLVVDAVFGIGPTRAITGHLADVVAQINHASRRLAVDLPSGMHADTGVATGAVVHADRTVAMGALKIALVSAPGFARCGRVEVADIGIPAGLIATATVGAGLIEDADVRRSLPQAGPLDHKGTRGHVVVVGGAAEMRGAARLAAIAALRVGAGRVTLAGDGPVEAPDPVMTWAISAERTLAAVVERKDAVVIGCGLGRGELARGRITTVLAAGVPVVLDADALNLLGAELEIIARASGPVVLTPHPAEAGRLLGTDADAVEADRLGAARALAGRTRAVVVLKGARTIVCDGTLGDDHCAINPTGGPALATAGTGDVLAGMIGGLLAQGVAPGDAARVAVYLHGAVGDVLWERSGRGAIASDLLEAIASTLRDLTRDV